MSSKSEEQKPDSQVSHSISFILKCLGSQTIHVLVPSVKKTLKKFESKNRLFNRVAWMRSDECYREVKSAVGFYFPCKMFSLRVSRCYKMSTSNTRELSKLD